MRRHALIQRGVFICATAAILAGGLGRDFAAERRGRPIEFSAPRDETVATNAADGLREQVREDLLKEKLRERVLKPFRPGDDALDGALAPQFVPPQRSLSPTEIRRIKEQLERNRSWAYSDTDTPGRDSSGEKFTDAPDAAGDNDTLSILKRQYQNLEAKNRLGSTNTSARSHNPDDPSTDDKGKSHDRDATTLSEETRRLTNPNALNGLFGERSGGELSPYGSRNSFSDAFAPPGNLVPTEPSRLDNERASEFRKLLDGGTPGSLSSSPLNPLGGLGGDSSPPGGGMGEIKALPTMATMPGFAPPLNAGSSLSPALAAPQDFTRRELPRPAQLERAGTLRRQF
jgi:hypothetical protein